MDCIKMTIRTGTSTRPPIRVLSIREQDHKWVSPLLRPCESMIIPIPLILGGSSFLDAILSQSFLNDGELRRDDTIKLNIKSRECGEGEKDNSCVVCMDSIKIREKISVLPECGHIFHTKCIGEWGMYKQECPICRAGIPSVVQPLVESKKVSVL